MNIKKLTIILFLLFGISGCQSDAEIENFLIKRPESTIAARQFISNWDQSDAKKSPMGHIRSKKVIGINLTLKNRN